jgi:SM-20-related protein
MPGADFFARFGLFVAKDFFDAEQCAELLAEVRSATDTPATVGIGSDTYAVDESTRRSKWANVSAETVSSVKARLLTLKPAMERHFDVALTDCQKPQFLVYREGDFFGAHPDRRPGSDDAAEFEKERRVSAVVFLNSESEAPGTDVYGGGSLTFYGLIGDSRMEGYGIPLQGESGLLVAFRPELVHEVTPVVHGERYTIVTWFR